MPKSQWSDLACLRRKKLLVLPDAIRPTAIVACHDIASQTYRPKLCNARALHFLILLYGPFPTNFQSSFSAASAALSYRGLQKKLTGPEVQCIQG